MSFGIIVKKYEHHNKAFGGWDSPKGKYIGSKKQYDEEMAKGGYVPYQEVHPKQMTWVPSADLKRTLREIQGQKEVGSKLVDKMKDMGVCMNPKFMPTKLEGGIE